MWLLGLDFAKKPVFSFKKCWSFFLETQLICGLKWVANFAAFEKECHPHWCVTPHGCHRLTCPLSPRCMGMVAAKYPDLWGQISCLSCCCPPQKNTTSFWWLVNGAYIYPQFPYPEQLCLALWIIVSAVVNYCIYTGSYQLLRVPNSQCGLGSALGNVPVTDRMSGNQICGFGCLVPAEMLLCTVVTDTEI